MIQEPIKAQEGAEQATLPRCTGCCFWLVHIFPVVGNDEKIAHAHYDTICVIILFVTYWTVLADKKCRWPQIHDLPTKPVLPQQDN